MEPHGAIKCYPKSSNCAWASNGHTAQVQEERTLGGELQPMYMTPELPSGIGFLAKVHALAHMNIYKAIISNPLLDMNENIARADGTSILVCVCFKTTTCRLGQALGQRTCILVESCNESKHATTKNAP